MLSGCKVTAFLPFRKIYSDVFSCVFCHCLFLRGRPDVVRALMACFPICGFLQDKRLPFTRQKVPFGKPLAFSLLASCIGCASLIRRNIS